MLVKVQEREVVKAIGKFWDASGLLTEAEETGNSHIGWTGLHML